MKKMIGVILLLCFYLNSNSQTPEEKNIRFIVGIYGSTPIFLTGTDKFFNDNWILKNGNASIAQERKYYKYAWGVQLQYCINQHLSVRGMAGISMRDLTEKYYLETVTSYLTNKDSKYFTYDQISINAMIGLNYAHKLNKFVINSGIELAYLRTGKGKQTHDDWISMSGPGWGIDSLITISKSIISGGTSYGLGIYLGTAYNASKHFSIGLEFHQFAYYSVFNHETTTDLRTHNYSFIPPDIIETSDTQENTTEKENFRQFCFSTITPFVTLQYHFNLKK